MNTRLTFASLLSSVALVSTVTASASPLIAEQDFLEAPGRQDGHSKASQPLRMRGKALREGTSQSLHMAPDLLQYLKKYGHSRREVRVIIQLEGNLDQGMRMLKSQYPMKVHHILTGIRAIAVEVPARQVVLMARERHVKWISPDRVVTQLAADPIGHIAVTTGASMVSKTSSNPERPSGDSVTIGIIDSGTCIGCDPVNDLYNESYRSAPRQAPCPSQALSVCLWGWLVCSSTAPAPASGC